MDDEMSRANFLSKITEKTIGAFRYLIEKHIGFKGFPVGFSVVFYNPDVYEKRWYYDMRVIIDQHDPNLLNRQTRGRIELANMFLSEGIKRIMQGEHDDMIIDPSKIDGQSFQVPGMKGTG